MLALVVTATALSPPASGAQASDPTSFRSARWVGFDITANRLNQYTVRTNASAIDVLGAAKATATVAVNGVGAYEKGEYFWRAVPVSNSSAPVYPTMSVVATEGANSTTNSGKVYLGPVQENFSYDLDGNLTADSRWDYTWDLENRLKRMETRSAAITAGVPRTRLDFAYDAEGRRTQKSVLTNWNGSVYQATNVTRFLYDPGIQTGGGWNLLAEVDGANNVRRSYAWGLDLMGNLETEGNIGGLLMVVDHTGGSAVCHFAAYDGNGNLTALVKTDQTVAARYEYGPFGEPIRLTGALAKANPFRWSTKFTDEESGLVDYGYRLYSPSLGRWMSRDPIEEEDIRNLYAFVGNRPIAAFDRLGLSILTVLPNPGEQSANAAQARTGASLIQRVQDAVDTFNDLQELTSIIMDAATGDPIDLLINLFQSANEGLSSGMVKKARSAGMVDHHVFPRRFGEAFGRAGIDPDKLTIGLNKFVHRKLHSGRGARGGAWNRAWENFLFKDGKLVKRDANEIFEFGAKMIYRFGLL
jgi:RHS repeat-associated protein